MRKPWYHYQNTQHQTMVYIILIFPCFFFIMYISCFPWILHFFKKSFALTKYVIFKDFFENLRSFDVLFLLNIFSCWLNKMIIFHICGKVKLYGTKIRVGVAPDGFWRRGNELCSGVCFWLKMFQLYRYSRVSIQLITIKHWSWTTLEGSIKCIFLVELF